jgi:hypothetical protein
MFVLFFLIFFLQLHEVSYCVFIFFISAIVDVETLNFSLTRRMLNPLSRVFYHLHLSLVEVGKYALKREKICIYICIYALKYAVNWSFSLITHDKNQNSFLLFIYLHMFIYKLKRNY